jgi:hypothetical protein
MVIVIVGISAFGAGLVAGYILRGPRRDPRD